MNWFSWKNWKWSKTKESTELKPLGFDSRVEQLQKENEKLRRTVDSLLANFGSDVQVGEKSLEGITKDDLENLKKLSMSQKDTKQFSTEVSKTDGVSVTFIEEGSLVRSSKSVVSSSSSSSSTSTTSAPVSTSSSVMTESKTDILEIDAGNQKTVFVKSAKKDEVAVVDMKNVEWWTIVNPDTLEEDDKDISYEDSELGDSFAVIQQDDVNESMANFLAVSIERHPDAKELTPAELKKVLDSTLAQAKRKGTLSQAYGWGMWLYSSYSWGSYIVRVYKEPTLVMLVLRAACVLYQQPLLIPVFARGLWSAASWALIAYL